MNVTIKDKQFKPYLDQQTIHRAVEKIGAVINQELVDDCPLFVVVLNGSFMFAADLLRCVTIPCEVSFVKLASYTGTSSSGSVCELIGLSENIEGRMVVIVEDIVDSGGTLEMLTGLLHKKGARQVRIATALFKPGSYKKEFKIDYVGFNIPDAFVVGYGMDYNGQGRNLRAIHVLV